MKCLSWILYSCKLEGLLVVFLVVWKFVIVVNVVRLKIELEFVVVEVWKLIILKEYEDEFKRFKLIKELVFVKVEMEVLIKMEVDGSNDLF